MRVISGVARGCNLLAPEGMDTRPTADRIKESLFNMLAPDLYDCVFLDIFSGTGAVAIEALSRGAKEAVLIEHTAKCAKVIRYNLEHTSLSKCARLIVQDYQVGLKLLAQENKKFDIIFLDPPYYRDYTINSLQMIMDYSILSPGGYIVAEQGSNEPEPNAPGLRIYKEKQYRRQSLFFLQREE